MKTTKVLVALLGPCLLANAGAAHAADKIHSYIEGSYAGPKLEGAGFSVTTGAAIMRAGVNFNPYLALEAVGAFGTSSATIYGYGIPVTLKIDNAYGAYVKGQYPVAPHFELFARAGWLHATLDATTFGGGGSSSNSSFSSSIGFQIPFGAGWYAQADYTSYYSNNGDTLRGPSIGIGYRFQ